MAQVASKPRRRTAERVEGTGTSTIGREPVPTAAAIVPTAAASLSARNGVRPSAPRSLCALISRRMIASYGAVVTVIGNPSGHGSGLVRKHPWLDTAARQRWHIPHDGSPQP
jgi:hypothetical protein